MALVNSIGFSILAFLFVLGIMIFIHELGHYLVAKFLGIRVDVFSLGFGLRLFGFRRGDTDYRISILPLGGYVKMAGENYDEELTGSPHEFLARPKLQRFAVAVAGPLMNIALAIILLTGTFIVGIPVPVYLKAPALIGKIEPGSPAEKAHLELHDQITAIEGEKTPTLQDVEIALTTSSAQELTLTIERQGESLHKKVTRSSSRERGLRTIGVTPFTPYVISDVEPGSPALQAGLRAGDEIVQVKSGDETASGVPDIPELISSRKEESLLFKIRRDAQIFEKTIRPVQMGDKVRIGITMNLARIEKYGFFEAVVRSVERNYQLTALTFDIVGKLITGRASIKTLSGPIEIARYSGVAASAGPIHLVWLMAVISLQLGIFNLLPIPILDGGLIALLALEGLMGRDLSLRVKERILQIGFIFLILLMGIVIFNDISKTLSILE